jgi:hypothetical protein
MTTDGPVPASERGLVPPTNDLVARVVILAVYVARFGVLAEGVTQVWWHVPLLLTTDVFLPLAAAAWLLLVPVWTVWTSCQE